MEETQQKLKDIANTSRPKDGTKIKMDIGGRVQTSAFNKKRMNTDNFPSNDKSMFSGKNNLSVISKHHSMAPIMELNDSRLSHIPRGDNIEIQYLNN
jgi:hypothetical protein